MLIGNVLRVGVTTFLSLITTFFLQSFMTNSLSLKDYGQVTIFVNFFTVMSTLVLCGFNDFFLKKSMVYPGSSNAFLREVSVIHLTLFVLFFICITIVTVSYSHTITLLFSLIALSGGLVLLLGAKYQVQGKFGVFALIQLIQPVTRFIVIFLMLYFAGATLENTAIGYFISALSICITSLFFIFYFDNNEKKVKLKFKSVIKESFPFSAATTLHMIYFQCNVLILGYLISAEAAAIFNVAFLIVSSVYIIPGIIYQKIILANLHRWFLARDRNRILKYNKLATPTFLMGVCFSALIYFSSVYFVPFVFGDVYIQSLNHLFVLSFAIPFRFASCNYGAILMVENNIKIKVNIMAFAAFLNVVLVILLVRFFDEIGVSYSIVITEIVLCCLYRYRVVCFFRKSFVTGNV